jgi:hypothetical protein
LPSAIILLPRWSEVSFAPSCHAPHEGMSEALTPVTYPVNWLRSPRHAPVKRCGAACANRTISCEENSAASLSIVGVYNSTGKSLRGSRVPYGLLEPILGRSRRPASRSGG